MFKKKPTVAVEAVTVTTWLHDDSRLKPGVSEIRFTQRWKTATYADHGTKLLRLSRNPSGKHRIIYEDLLNSERGWDRTPDPNVKKMNWKAVAEGDPAFARWLELAPTGKNYQDRLAAIPDDKEVRRQMARALIAKGNFECKEVAYEGECGVVLSDMDVALEGDAAVSFWLPLKPTATFASPCLQRRLAEWALDQLEEGDVFDLLPALERIVALPKPESKLPRKVLALAANAFDKTRMTLLEAAVKAGHTYAAGDHLKSLSEASLVRALRKFKLPSAIDLLDPARSASALKEALADDKIEVQWRRRIIKRLRGNSSGETVAALVKLVSDKSCELAMGAAEALAARGKTNYLPHRPKSQDAKLYGRAICMLVHAVERDKLWNEFLPPKGKAELAFESETDCYTEGDEELDDEEEEARDTPLSHGLARGMPTLTVLDNYTRFEATIADGFSCSADSCSAGADEESEDHLTIEFEKAPDGGLYISNVEIYSWTGCDC